MDASEKTQDAKMHEMVNSAGTRKMRTSEILKIKIELTKVRHETQNQVSIRNRNNTITCDILSYVRV